MKILKHHKLSPLSRYCTWSWVPAASVLSSIRKFEAGSQPRSPEAEALKFYLGEHALSILSKKYDEFEPLPSAYSEVVRKIGIEGNMTAAYSFAYLLYICIRESRHASDASDLRGYNKAVYDNVYKKICGLGCDSIHGAFLNLYLPEEITLGDLTDWLVYFFREGNFSKGYGGEPWAGIALCLDDFVSGASPLNVMVDKSFALAHNGGPIFNKGMFFSTYDAFNLALILDVQRSGQIPELVRDQDIPIPSPAVNMASYVIPAIDSELGPYLDWFKVPCSNDCEDYDNFKSIQTSKHGGKSDHEPVISGHPIWKSSVSNAIDVIGRNGLA